MSSLAFSGCHFKHSCIAMLVKTARRPESSAESSTKLSNQQNTWASVGTIVTADTEWSEIFQMFDDFKHRLQQCKTMQDNAKKKARRHGRRAFWVRSLAVSYFRMGTPTLSSALSSFTSEFGKGSGGSHSLWPPGNSVARLPSGTPHK
jgi:hypothetical protein